MAISSLGAQGRLACGQSLQACPIRNECQISLSRWSGAQPAKVWRRRRDSNPRDPFGSNGFQDRRFQPLTHSSVSNSSVIRELAARLLHFGFELLHFGARCSWIGRLVISASVSAHGPRWFVTNDMSHPSALLVGRLCMTPALLSRPTSAELWIHNWRTAFMKSSTFPFMAALPAFR